MESECLLPYSQKLETVQYSVRDEQILHPPHPVSLRSILIFSHLRLNLLSGLFSSRFTTNKFAFLSVPKRAGTISFS
jgi:hypothetical protein